MKHLWMMGAFLVTVFSYQAVRCLRTGLFVHRGGIVLKRGEKPREYWVNVGSLIAIAAMGFALIIASLMMAPESSN